MTFLANENIPSKSISMLRDNGHHVISIAEEMRGAKDKQVLEKAHLEQLIILTYDSDYGELIYKNQQRVPLGVVYFRLRPQTPELVAQVLGKVIEANIPLENKFTTIGENKIRQRTLQ